MKKTLSTVLVLILLLSFTGCQKKSKAPTALLKRQEKLFPYLTVRQ